MTYALPWRYSTTELKGLHLSQFPNKEPSNMDMSLVHLFVTAYTQIIYIEYRINRFFVHSNFLTNNKLDLPSEYSSKNHLLNESERNEVLMPRLFQKITNSLKGFSLSFVFFRIIFL